MDKEKRLEKLKGTKVGVLYGGMSNEREVSLESGRAVLDAFGRMGINAVGIDAGPDMVERVREHGVDVAFIALHGRYGEDGCVQGALELAGVAYTGSGVTASAVAMNKALTKQLLQAQNVATPSYKVIDKREFENATGNVGVVAPVVIKPVSGGSSIGVAICHKDDEIRPALAKAFGSDDKALAERFINGALITVGIVGERVLPAVEIETKTGFYDYSSKYVPGNTVYHIPARAPKPALDEAGRMAMDAHKTLGCFGMSRSEFIVDSSGKPWFLELNTIPGMTSASLLPKAAKAVGMDFDELALTVLETALEK